MLRRSAPKPQASAPSQSQAPIKSTPPTKDLTFKAVDVAKLKQVVIGQNSAFLKLDTFNRPYVLRVLPPIGNMPDDAPWVEHYSWFLKTGKNRSGFETEDGSKRSLTHLAVHVGESDPIDEIIAWAEASGRSDVTAMFELDTQYYMNVVVVNEDPNVVRVYGAKTSIVKSVKDFIEGPYGNITHPVSGRNIQVTKTGDPSRWNTIRYKVMPLDASPISNWAEIRGGMSDLSTLVRITKREDYIAILQRNLNPAIIPLREIF